MSIRTAPTRLVIAGGMGRDSADRVNAALDTAHAEQHLSVIVLVITSTLPGLEGIASTHALARRWAERNDVAVQSWFFVPSAVDMDRWLTHESQADVVLRLPGTDHGIQAAAHRLGLTVLAADGRTSVAGLAPRRKTLRFFPVWSRPGRALMAA